MPATVICCTLSAADLARMMDPEHDWHSDVRELTLVRDVEFVDLPTGHWPRFSRPVELGEAIAAAITR